MGKRTAADANFDCYADYPSNSMVTSSTNGGNNANNANNANERGVTNTNSFLIGDLAATRRQLLESPEPLVWRITESVEPAGACHTRVRATPRPKQFRLPLADGIADPSPSQVDEAPNANDHANELLMSLPPLITPRPRRVVSPELLFQSSQLSCAPMMPTPMPTTSQTHANTLASRCWSFRPIGADRSDVELTSPPPRAMNPVVLDSRFKNMQRLDLQLDARDAPLQPFHRPYAQRRSAAAPPTMVFTTPPM